MKTIGLLGGMSWESTIPYYRQINQRIKQQLGGLHSAKIILYSVDFADIEALQRSGDWDKAGQLLADAGVKLQTAGADCIVLCTNTMHKVVSVIETAVTIPLLHIADATAESYTGGWSSQSRFTRHPLYHGAGFLQKTPDRSLWFRSTGAG